MAVSTGSRISGLPTAPPRDLADVAAGRDAIVDEDEVRPVSVA